MKRPWAFICASEGATSKHLRNYCREVYLLGYLPVCPKLQDSQYLVLEDAVERSEYTAIVRDKLLRCPMLVVCSRNQDATTNAQIGLAQKYNRIVTTLDGLKKAVSERRRGHVIPLRLNEREYRHLCEQVKISGFSREEYLRSLILGKEIHPRPCTHHAELVRQISGLCNNANQLAHHANSTGVAGQQSVDEMMRIAKEVWHEIKENY